MATESANGNLTADGTEQDITTKSAAGNYQLTIDLVNMQDADIVELRFYAKARSADSTQRKVYEATYANAQALPVVSSPAVSSSSCKWTLKQTAGTNRSFTWAVMDL